MNESDFYSLTSKELANRIVGPAHPFSKLDPSFPGQPGDQASHDPGTS